MPDFSDLKARVLHHLEKGSANAIIGQRLAALCGETDTRQVRLAIRDLIKTDKALIGLSIRKPFGYYLIETPEELDRCAETLKGYCIEAALHRRDLKVAARSRLFKQAAMKI